MADQVRQVDYYVLRTPDKPGAGGKILSVFKKERVSFAAVHAFPAGKGMQVDLVPKDGRKFLRVARKAGMRLSQKKKAFLAEGSDRAGGLVSVLDKVAAEGINVTAVTGLAAGKGRYGAIFWVKAKDYARAVKALGAK
ncbi:MAG TPA: hypothetical protein DDZ83_01660 [Nitrospinae bacterium]|nr:hypothetical protein [Nitrospinota bacterium]